MTDSRENSYCFRMILLFVAVSMLSHYALANKNNTTTTTGQTPKMWSFRKKYQWVEYEDAKGHINVDTFFDRVVLVCARHGVPSSTGIFINQNIILTSYNPYRDFLNKPKAFWQEKTPLNYTKMIVKIFIYRNYTTKTLFNILHVDNRNVYCARQVVPLPPESIAPNQWHGTDGLHSPLHDLMILRTSVRYKYLDPDPDKYPFSLYTRKPRLLPPLGPIVTKYAEKDDQLSRKIKFAGLGFVDKHHIKSRFHLRSREYLPEDNVVVNCDDYIPKQWGRFICLANIDNFRGLSSGAVLVSDNTVFGLGSFFLKKGNRSYLIFTDIRPYSHIINYTCTGSDSMNKRFFGIPPPTPPPVTPPPVTTPPN